MRLLTSLLAAGCAISLNAACAQDRPPPPTGGFRDSDANGDGVLTRAEFDAHNLSRFARMDRNSDGAITEDERRPPPDARPDAPVGRAGGGPGWGPAPFAADANNDGVVSRSEFDASSAAMFDRLDANDDGRIAQDEMPSGPPPRGHP